MSEIIKLKQQMASRQSIVRAFDIPQTIVCKANHVEQRTIPLSTQGDIELKGYNIAYDLTQAGLDVLSIKFTDLSKSYPFSSDFVPLRLISTPGAKVAGEAGIRYHYREFHRYIQKNGDLFIEINNPSDEELTVDLLLICNIWPYYSNEG